jgi:hypothetical protein
MHTETVPPKAAHLLGIVTKRLVTDHPATNAIDNRNEMRNKVPERDPDNGMVIAMRTAATMQPKSMGSRQAKEPFRRNSLQAKPVATPRQSKEKADQ